MRGPQHLRSSELMRAIAGLSLLFLACGPDLIPPQEVYRGHPFLELARKQHPPDASRTEGVVHFRGVTVAEAEVTVVLRNGLRAELVTDELGRFTLATPSRHVKTVFARADNLVGMRELVQTSERIDVELRVPWKVTGTVRDATGSPVSGAQVMGSWQRSFCIRTERGLPMAHFATGAHGMFFVELPEPQAWISAGRGGRTSIKSVNLFGATEWSELDLRTDSRPVSAEALERPYDPKLQLDAEPPYQPWVNPNSRRIDLAFRAVTETGAPVDGVELQGTAQVASSENAVIGVQWTETSYGSHDLLPTVPLRRRGYLTSHFTSQLRSERKRGVARGSDFRASARSDRDRDRRARLAHQRLLVRHRRGSLHDRCGRGELAARGAWPGLVEAQ